VGAVSFLRGLLTARSHLAFLVGLVAAAAVVRLASMIRTDATDRARGLALQDPPLRGAGPLAPRERAAAAAAWSYVQRNTDPSTGLAASVQGHPSTTMWDLGSQLMAVLAAEDLELAAPEEAEARIGRVLASLARMPLCAGSLPNKAYDVRTLAMVDYDDRPVPGGTGWSSLDLGRLAVPLAVVIRRHPALTPAVERAIARWDLAALSDGQALLGASRLPDGSLAIHQEGRFGYEGYAARALLPWGVPAPAALDGHAHLAYAQVSGVAVPHDDRSPREHGGAHAAVLSEPWILTGLEQGFDAETLAHARAVLRVQERRYAATGRLTAVSEDTIDRPPWFVYSAVMNGGDRWTAFAPDGAPAQDALGFSTKAALAWAVLFEGPYAERLRDAALALVGEDGVYAGRYDATGQVNQALALNTNAVVLEALAYRVHGPFLRRRPAGFPPPIADITGPGRAR
jgi:hypothetical protein